jgi:hypothetical protein
MIAHWRDIEKYLTRVRVLVKLGRSVTWPSLLPRLEKLSWSDRSYEPTHLVSNLLSHAIGNLFTLSVLSNLGVKYPLMKSFSTTGLDLAASVQISTAIES